MARALSRRGKASLPDRRAAAQLPRVAAPIYTPAMLKFFRRFTTSAAGPIILGLVTFAFLLLGPRGAGGIQDVLGGRIKNAVVQAGSRTITQQDFTKIFNERKRQLEQQTQQAFPLEEALRAGADQQMVSELASQAAYAEFLSRSGVRPTDDVVRDAIRREVQSGQGTGLSELFDPVTGKFSQAGYDRFLARNEMTRAEFDRQMRDSLANLQFVTALANGFHVPRIYSAVEAALRLENRDITYFAIPTADFHPPPPPTDAQLKAVIAQFHDQLMLPERRRLTIIRFSAKTLAPTMTVDPATVQQQFHAREASYGKPEQRSFVEIPLNDPHTAATVQARLQQGEDPEAVARALGVAAVPYVDQPQSAVADVKAGVAAFAMQAGQVSGPVQGDFKTVIIKVTKITPGQAPNLEAARPQIEQDLKMQAALERVYDLTQKYDDAREAGSSMADAAAKVGVTTLSLGPVAADGSSPPAGQPNPLLTQKLLKTAFSLPAGGDSEVEQDADRGEYYAVHVDQVIAPNPPGLDEPGVRQGLTQFYIRQAAETFMQTRSSQAEAAIKAGATMEAAAKGATVAHQVGLQRNNAQQDVRRFGQQMLAKIFSAKPGEVFSVLSEPLGSYVVARVDAIRPADVTSIAMMARQLGARADNPYLEGISAALRASATRTIKPRTDLALADAAMGADAAMLARVRPAAAKPGGRPAAAPARPGLAQ